MLCSITDATRVASVGSFRHMMVSSGGVFLDGDNALDLDRLTFRPDSLYRMFDRSHSFS